MRPWVRNAGLVLGLIGLFLVAHGLYEGFAGRAYQLWHRRQLDSTLQTAPAQPQPLRVNPYKTGDVIGQLEIARIGLSTMLFEGDDEDTLRLGAGRDQHSPLPGEPGNVVVAGHRDTFFRPLERVRDGDRIELKTPNGTFHYVVAQSEVVDQTDIAVLGATRRPTLTLVTCYPFNYVGAAPERFIVRARLDESLPVTPSTTSTMPKPSAFPSDRPAAVRAAVTKSKQQSADQPAPASAAPAHFAPPAQPTSDPTMLAAAGPTLAASPSDPPPADPATSAPALAPSGAAPPSTRRGIARLNPVPLFRKIAKAVKHPKKDTAAESLARDDR